MITTIPDRERALQAQVDALTAEIARLRAVEPVAWKHDCAGLCTNDVELWIDACPHCGKPRAAPPAQPAEPTIDEQVASVNAVFDAWRNGEDATLTLGLAAQPAEPVQRLTIKPTVQRLMNLARVFRAMPGDLYDKAYKELEEACYSAIESALQTKATK